MELNKREKPHKAGIYYDGKLILTVVGYMHETEQELWYRVRENTLVVVPPLSDSKWHPGK